MRRNRTSATLYLFLVFASGMLMGVFSHSLYITKSASASSSPQNIAEFRKRYLAEMRTKVKVNDGQVTAVTGLLDDAKRKFDALHAQETPLHDKIQQDLIDSIRAQLSDDQKVAYDKWRIEREQAKAKADSAKR
jgi:uncharacterized protein YnzC (UPF0291/DUF896 family)